ncbi:MAG: agmatinase [Ignavibacteria bacterium]|nr:MAG: agmatinase [Ignavibacteria bacterium]
MKHLDAQSNFLGLDIEHASLDAAAIAILQAPYEHSVSYGGGTGGGPAAILEASHYVEFWDEEFQRELCFDLGITTLEALRFDQLSDAAALDHITTPARELLKRGKFVVTLGGEHTVAAAAISAHLEQWPEMTVLQIDAHSDLRESYEGNPYSHASVMARVLEKLPADRLVQVGIRAQCREEFERIQQDGINTFFGWEIRQGIYGQSWKERVLDACGENVYITFDVDGLDPSIMPSTGTPEPGGLYWDETIQLMKMLGKHRRIVGFDVVELAPVPGAPAPDFLAAKLVYKMLNAAFTGR